jgi:hypothetical protein
VLTQPATEPTSSWQATSPALVKAEQRNPKHTSLFLLGLPATDWAIRLVDDGNIWDVFGTNIILAWSIVLLSYIT